MFRLSFKSFINSIYTNILLIVQFTIIMVLVITAISSFENRVELYAPLRDIYNADGYYGHMSSDDYIQKEILENLSGVNNFLCSYNAVNSSGENEYSIRAYDDKIINAYTPALSDGVWLNKSDYDNTDNTVPVVISNNPDEYVVGDTFEMEFSLSSGADKVLINCQVFGLLEDNGRIFGSNTYTMNDDFRNVFEVYSVQQGDRPIIIFNEKYKEKYDIYMDYSGSFLVSFDESLSDEEVKSNSQYLFDLTPALIRMEEFRDHSLSYILSEIYILIPIAIGIILLVIISIFNCTSINTKRNMKNYGIYYLCGANIYKCLLVELINVLFTSAISVLFTYSVLRYLSASGRLKNTIISFGTMQFAVCAFVILLFIVITLIMPFVLLSKTQPSEIIKSE